MNTGGVGHAAMAAAAAVTERSSGLQGITTVINELENKFTFYRTTTSTDEVTPSQSPPNDMDPLLRDIDLLSGILGDIVKRENPVVFDVSTWIPHLVLTAIEDSHDDDVHLSMCSCTRCTGSMRLQGRSGTPLLYPG